MGATVLLVSLTKNCLVLGWMAILNAFPFTSSLLDFHSIDFLIGGLADVPLSPFQGLSPSHASALGPLDLEWREKASEVSRIQEWGLWLIGILVWAIMSIAAWLGARTIGKLRKELRLLRQDHDHLVYQLSLKEERVSTLSHMLSDQEESLGVFANRVAHDINVPMSLVMGSAQHLAHKYKGQLQEEIDQFLFYVSQSGQQLQQNVEGLLAYAQVLDNHPMETEVIDLEGLIWQVSAELSKDLVEHHCQLIIAPDLPVVKGNRPMITRLFREILDNSLKFAKPDISPVIEIHVESYEKEKVRIEVTDNGVGISPDGQKEVFKMFRKLRPGGTKGIGMGLAICKKIVERHRGEIKINSQKGLGTTIHFTLPAVKPEA